MADNPVRRRTRRAAERIARQRRKGLIARTGRSRRERFSEVEIGFLHSKTMGAIEIRGDAEPHFKGGESVNPRFPNFKPEFVRVRPHRIISWGVETEGFAPRARTVN